ncbi:MAG: molybdopterin molybdenumtransferase MoeA, partial [Chloroflexi bacterium]|nr:molybdopterin molybdenumtransferase MoeA [Chloroflexota bacterium]
MAEFFNVLAPDEALVVLREHLSPHVELELSPTSDALGRVAAEPVRSPEALPSFPRALARRTMDGFSVRASDTFGATEGLPAYLTVVGEVPMGRAPEIT